MPQLGSIAIDKIRRTVGIVLRQPRGQRVDHETRFGGDGFWAKITGSAAMSGNANRYQYAWTQQRETDTGWEDEPDGLTGTTSTDFALNSIEANNPDDPSTATMGNSVDTEATSTTLSPVSGEPVVWMRVGGDRDGDTTFRFSYENSVDCGG